jgi:hypothetical protein
MELHLQQFEDNLHRTMGLDKELDPEVVSTSLFGEALKDVEVPEPKPSSQGYTTKDDFAIPGSQFDDMLAGGNADHRVTEPLESALDSDDEEQYRQ